MDDEKKKQLLKMSIDAILDTSAKSPECLREESISPEEAKSSIDMCSCCSDGRVGVESSFKEYQLLGAGQAIDLHAAKYCIDTDDENKASFVTELPNWAASLSNDGLEWLN